MKLAFISDLHLSPKTPHSNQIFFNLIAKWQTELDGLYILGDFFDYWLGDDDTNEFIESIKTAIRQFTQHKPIYFIGGNHDFAIGKKFAKQTGITLLRDCSTITIGPNKILLSHGDVFCSLDIKYQKMKKILQNPLTVFILKRTPLSWRYKIKELLENKSAQSFNLQPTAIYHVVDHTIVDIANKHGANMVIHGHTHKPGKYTIENEGNVIQRFEIPDWSDRKPGGYILLEDDQITVNYS